jgi:hypothetical protein
MLKRYFPILDWAPGYSRHMLTDDLVAAVIVTIMLIPQSLAYALLAGLPAEVGTLRLDRAACRLCGVWHLAHARRGSGGGGSA